MNRKLRTLTALLSLTLPLVAQAVPAAATSRTISGTISAADGHSLKGTILMACPEGDCSSEGVKSIVVEGAGPKLTFTLQGLDAQYVIYAAQDADGNEDRNVGDWVDRNILEDRGPTLTRVGTTDLKIELVELR